MYLYGSHPLRKHFAILEDQNPPIDGFYVVQKRRSIDFELFFFIHYHATKEIRSKYTEILLLARLLSF